MFTSINKPGCYSNLFSTSEPFFSQSQEVGESYVGVWSTLHLLSVGQIDDADSEAFMSFFLFLFTSFST